MKQLIIFLTILVGLNVPANATETHTSQTAPKLTDAEAVVFLDGITPSLNDTFVINMAAELCGIVQHTQMRKGYQGAEALERNLLRFANLSKNDSKYKQKIAVFWNYYSDQMICPAASGFNPTQHLFARVLDSRVHRPVLEDYFFSDPIAFPIDVNVIEILHTGRPITFIDYIDAALAMEEVEDKYDVDEVEYLRDYLIKKFGAKKAGEMNPTEHARRTAHAKKYSIYYKPMANKKSLPSPRETPTACTTSVLAQIQEHVKSNYEFLGHEIISSGVSGADVVYGKKRNIFPSEIKCFSHRDFGTVFRQTIGVEYTKGAKPRELDVVYWRALSGDKGMRSDIF